MFSPSVSSPLRAFIAALVLIASLGSAASTSAAERVLRVCADPNNLPFSNRQGDGFENRIAELLAKDLGAGLEYTWWVQRRSFVRNTLRAGECDLLMVRQTVTNWRLPRDPITDRATFSSTGAPRVFSRSRSMIRFCAGPGSVSR
jgi:ABC-type amino acid transport substrate-binding protein